MAVFTEVTHEEASSLLADLGLGTLQSIQGCASGIENTNYFVSTDRGDYVLTLFERLSFEQLPFYLNLMHHLAAKGIPVPAPQANAKGEITQGVPQIAGAQKAKGIYDLQGRKLTRQPDKGMYIEDGKVMTR